MKKIIYSLVIMIAASSLFTSCIEQVEPAGIETLRDAKAEYLLGVKQLRLAEAEVQKAQATYWQALAAVEQANAAYRDAQTEGQKLRNDMQALLNEAQEIANASDSLDLAQKAAQIAANIETIKANAKIAAVEAQQNLANAQENLRIALAKIAADQLKLTDAQAAAVSTAIAKYEFYLGYLLTKEEELSAAIAYLWDLQYKDENEYYNAAEKYKKAIAFNEGEAAKYAEMMENVPEDADVEAWAEEVNTYEDLLEQYQYDAYKVATDAAKYKADVWHCGHQDYTAAFDAWVEESPFNDIAEVVAFDPEKEPAEPKEKDFPYTNYLADTLQLQEFVYDPAKNGSAEYVYMKFSDLLGKYTKIENPYSKRSPKTKIGTVETENGIKTVNVLAGQALKDFVLGSEDATALTCTVKVGSTEYTLSANYGMKGALSTIKRDLVILKNEAPKDVEKNYNEAKALWEADRDTLIKGLKEYKPYVDAVADTVAAWEALEAVKEEVGNGSKAMVDAIDALVEAWNKSNGTSPISKNDSLALHKAIIDFAVARERYLDYTPGPNDGNYFRYGYDMTDGYDSVAFRALEYSGFVPTTTFAKGLYARKKGFSDEDFIAGYNTAFAHVIIQLFGETMAGMINESPVAKFPEDKQGIADCINNKVAGVLHCEAFYGLYKLAVVDDNFVIKGIYGTDYIPAKLKEAEEAYNEAQAALHEARGKYEKVYKRYWGAGESLPTDAEDEYNVEIYTLETFTKPYNVVVFNGKQILYSDALGAILASVDAKEGYYGKSDNNNKKTQQQNWKYGDNICASVTFGANDAEGTNMTDFAKYMYYKAQYDGLTNWQAFQEAIERIENWIKDCEKAFEDQVDAAKTKANSEFKKAKEKYAKDLEAFNKQVAAYKELTGSDEKVAIYRSFKFPDTITDDVTGIDNIAGEWKMAEGSKMYEWAEAFLPNYPENLAEWKEIEENRTEQISHLQIIITALKGAYQAAKDVKDLEEQFKAAGVDISELSAANTWDKYVEAYNKAKAAYLTAVTQKYNDYVEEVETYKMALAKYEAGYDATLLNIEIAEDAVIKAEQAVADALAQLKIAEAEYNKVMAAYCPAE